MRAHFAVETAIFRSPEVPEVLGRLREVPGASGRFLNFMAGSLEALRVASGGSRGILGGSRADPEQLLGRPRAMRMTGY